MSIIKSITSINFSSVSNQKALSSFDNAAIDKLNFGSNQTACGCADFGSAGSNIINIDIDINSRARRACC